VRHFHTQFHPPGSLDVSPGPGLSASPPIENVTAPAIKKQIYVLTSLFTVSYNKMHILLYACYVQIYYGMKEA